jgi:hypothetical protein
MNSNKFFINAYDRKKTLQNEVTRFNNLKNTVINPKNISLNIVNENLLHNQINHDNDNIYYLDNSNIIRLLHNKNIKVINNVYQDIYKDNIKPTGFGDFIRGCYFTMHFCRKFNFHLNIIINHPVAYFLKNYKDYYESSYSKLYHNVFSDILMCTFNNMKETKMDSNNYIIDVVKKKSIMNEFLNYLYKMTVHNNNIFIYNIMFPYDKLSERDLNYMQKILEPSLEMDKYIDETLDLLNLNKREYVIIHIRCGDEYLTQNNTNFAIDYIKKIFQELTNIFNNNYSKNYLLIADNNEIKQFLVKMFPNIKTLYKEITHLGEDANNLDKIKNTMLDFYLIANSNYIYSFTSYLHGSGFSLWSATTYGIPYSCKYVK